MINYSIALRAVNPNLFEINQAKTRIKSAKASGQTPDPADEALAASTTLKAFAVAQYSDIVTIEKFARHISDHGSVYSRADITAILYLAVDCMREMLLDGKKIRLGDLGDFSISLTSRGADSAEKFTAQNITAVSVQWDCGPDFRNLIADAQFNLVASRAAQAAVLKALKAGQDNVALTPDTNGGAQPNPDGQQPNPAARYTLTLAAQPAGGGTVSGAGSYAQGATATLVAQPAAGYTFSRWDDGDTQATRTVTVSADKTYTATFTATTPGSNTGSNTGTGSTTEEG